MIEPLENRRLFSVGQLDPSFGAGGVVAIPNTTDTGTFSVVKTLTDGKFLLARVVQGSNPNASAPLVITRYLANGTIDTTFGGTGGQPAGSISPANFVAFHPIDFDIDSSGRMLLAGSWGGEMAVVRLTAGGTLDVAFGGTSHGMPANTPTGMAVAALGVSDEVANDLAIAPDGRIGVVGTSDSDTMLDESGIAAVFTADGTLIPALSSVWAPANTTFDDRSTFGAGHAAAFTSDGGFLVGGFIGTASLDGPTRETWSLTKYGTTGNVWHSTGPVGLAGNFQDVGAISVLAGDQILVAGNAGPSIVVTRLTSAGAIDTTFGTVGVTQTLDPSAAALPVADRDRITTSADKIAVLPDGRFYVLGHNFGAPPSAFLARYTADGALDPVYPGPFFVAPVLSNFSDGLNLINDDPVVTTVEPTNSVPGTNPVLNIHHYHGGVSALRNSKGTLQVQGTSAGDVIAITRRHKDNRIVVRINGDTLVQSFPPKPVKRIQAFGFGGNDTITIGPDLPFIGYIEGGAGNDALTGGDAADTIIGGAGNDSILGNAGNDHLSGNGGRDVLRGGIGDDSLNGGPGSADQIFGDGGNDSAANDTVGTYDAVEHLIN